MTPKQHQFAREIVLGKSQADAYRTAYDTLRMNDNSIRREASRLMDNPNVATTVAELQQKADNFPREDVSTPECFARLGPGD